jgi:signal transduction histidine kinase/ligand-binding sensor domain-containing protein
MKNILRHYLLLSFLFITCNGAAQTSEVKFNLVSGSNGIALGKLKSIAQDKYGFMWFADQTNQAIIRFDGHHMKRYQYDAKNPNGMRGYSPESLAADSLGNIWIGYYGTGLDKFDPVTGRFTHYRHDPNDKASLSSDIVSVVLVDHLGNVWVGSDGGLDLLDQKTGKFKHYIHAETDSTSLSHNLVKAIYEDKTGELWVGTGWFNTGVNIGGLNRFHRDTETFTRYLSDPANPNTLIDNRVKSIFEDSHGTFWVGTSGDGLHTLDRKTGLFKRLTYDPSRPEQLSGPPPINPAVDHITFILEDSDKKLWIGTWTNGLTRYDPLSKTITRYGNKEVKVMGTNVFAYATPDGFIWLVNQETGLLKIDINNTIIPHVEMGGFNNFYEQGDSIGWFATSTGLVRKDFKTGGTRKFVHDPANPNSLSDSRVKKIVKDKAGGFWIGTMNGLNHFDVETEIFTRYYHNPGSNKDNEVYAIYEDSDSTLWVSNLGQGLDLLNWKTGKFTNYKKDPADTGTISINSISALQMDEANELWIGTFGGGLNKLNQLTGKFRHYLPGGFILSIYRDASGFIWVGSGSGLHRYDKPSDRFDLIYNENNQNVFGAVFALTNDKENNLWMSAKNGIFTLNKKRNLWYQYGKDNGIGGDGKFFSFLESSFVRQNGEIIFGDNTGYYAFHPKKIKTITGTTHLYFTGFWLDNKEIVPVADGPLKESLYQAKEIILNHDQNVFSFSATLVDFHAAGDKSILYQLENYDKDWRKARPGDQIQYNMVPPGEYLLRIKTTGNNGEWIEKSIAVVISPPWWNTWPAYIVYALMFMASVFSVHRVQRNRVIRAERERAREREFAQAKEIEKAYTELKATQSQLIQSEKMASLGELTAGIAHEIQNPLNFINNFSDVNAELLEELKVEADRGNIDEVKAIADDVITNEHKINHHGKRADAIVKGMLQHSRSTTGNRELTDVNDLVDEYVKLAFHAFRGKDNAFDVKLLTDFDPAVGAIELAPQEVGRVLVNILNNAFYAVNERKKNDPAISPEVIVQTKKTAKGIEISVKDNGVGIPESIRGKVFQPFFTTKPTGQGTGLGLSLSYDIVKANGGEIKVESGEGKGSTFIIQL